MDALLADRAKQEADEASMSTRSHHQKVAGGNRTEKDLGGASLDDLALDLDAFDPPATSSPSNVVDRVLEHVFCHPLYLSGVNTQRGVGANEPI